MSISLTLPQSLLLLSLKDESGRPQASFYKPAIAGAGISELLLRGSLQLTDDKKPKLVAASKSTSQGPFLDLILTQISADKKQRDMQSWTTKLASHKSLVPVLAEELRKLGAVTKQTSKLFGLFTLTSWPEASPKLESNLKVQLKEAIAGTGEVEDRLSVIIALAKSADVLRHNFDRGFLKSNAQRIKAIADGELLATGATEAAIKAAKAAITATIVVAAVAPTVT
ncbi:MAG: GPP34 family phosphoprotein [Henriciella sp.]|nr:GPP34 family phosphoprotein [Henriciella sp.]